MTKEVLHKALLQNKFLKLFVQFLVTFVTPSYEVLFVGQKFHNFRSFKIQIPPRFFSFFFCAILSENEELTSNICVIQAAGT